MKFTELEIHLLLQGLSAEEAEDLCEQKRLYPALIGAVHRGRWISLVPPTEDSIARFDEMVENCCPPMSNTDREFMEGHCNGNQFEKTPEIGDDYRQRCHEAGGTTHGKKYLSQLARFPGDPEAWVSSRSDAQRVLEARGWGSTGSVTVKAREPEPVETKPIDVADKILDRETAKDIEGQTVTKKEYVEKREKTRQRLKPSWK